MAVSRLLRAALAAALVRLAVALELESTPRHGAVHAGRSAPKRGAAASKGSHGHKKKAAGSELIENENDLFADNTYDLDDVSDETTVEKMDMDSDLDGPDEVGAKDEHEPIVNFLPEQRMKMHRQKYERDFVVNISMTEMLQNGHVLGLKLHVDTDFEPVSVHKVKKLGLVQDWNNQNPKWEIRPGDEITRVNDITWHHNSKTFSQRIKGQYLAARHKTAGASDVLQLYISRPRTVKQNRTDLQRDDLHYRMFAKEYSVKLAMPGKLDVDMLKGMGWELGSRNNKSWHPLTVNRIHRGGVMARWNELHPDSIVIPGDELVSINNISWHGNSSMLLSRILTQYKRARHTPRGPNKTLVFEFRRTRAHQEEFDKMFPVKEEVVWTTEDLKAALKVPKAPKDPEDKQADTKTIGWQLKWKNNNTPPAIEKIRAEGMLADFNAAFPTDALQVGDRIVKVNDIPWHNNTQVFVTRISKQLEASMQKVYGAPKRLTLRAQRRHKKLSEIRVPVLEEFTNHVADWERTYTTTQAPDETQLAVKPGIAYKVVGEHLEAVEQSTEKLKSVTAAWNKQHPEDKMDLDYDKLKAALAIVEAQKSASTTAPEKVKLASAPAKNKKAELKVKKEEEADTGSKVHLRGSSKVKGKAKSDADDFDKVGAAEDDSEADDKKKAKSDADADDDKVVGAEEDENADAADDKKKAKSDADADDDKVIGAEEDDNADADDKKKAKGKAKSDADADDDKVVGAEEDDNADADDDKKEAKGKAKSDADDDKVVGAEEDDNADADDDKKAKSDADDDKVVGAEEDSEDDDDKKKAKSDAKVDKLLSGSDKDDDSDVIGASEDE